MTFIYTPPEPMYPFNGRARCYEDAYSINQLRSEVERVRREDLEIILRDVLKAGYANGAITKVEDVFAEIEWQVRERVRRETVEACAKVCYANAQITSGDELMELLK